MVSRIYHQVNHYVGPTYDVAPFFNNAGPSWLFLVGGHVLQSFALQAIRESPQMV